MHLYLLKYYFNILICGPDGKNVTTPSCHTVAAQLHLYSIQLLSPENHVMDYNYIPDKIFCVMKN